MAGLEQHARGGLDGFMPGAADLEENLVLALKDDLPVIKAAGEIHGAECPDKVFTPQPRGWGTEVGYGAGHGDFHRQCSVKSRYRGNVILKIRRWFDDESCTAVKLAQLFGLTSRQADASQAIELCHKLLEPRGEVSASRLAGELLSAYEALEPPDREAFFDRLIRDFSPDPEAVGKAGEAYRKDPSGQNLTWLQEMVEPPRRELFRRLNMAPGGTRILVEMRGELLRQADEHPHRKPIAADLAYLLTAWFNRGFLSLRRIDWRTSAMILEKLILYEAVHEIQGWRDLRRRLEADRRCYAFFHPALPDEPIIFIEAALTRGMSDRVQPLLDPDSPVLNPKLASCAVFYSITNCQEGLRGVPFGSFLLKQVLEDLQTELPQLKRFATASPIPGFMEWLAAEGFEKLVEAIQERRWLLDSKFRAELERRLPSMCAYYLLHAKQGNHPLDPVARFHLRNGAYLERINFLGDTSDLGVWQSAGLLANYVYNLGDVERNHELYARDHRVIASHELQALAKQAGKFLGGAE